MLQELLRTGPKALAANHSRLMPRQVPQRYPFRPGTRSPGFPFPIPSVEEMTPKPLSVPVWGGESESEESSSSEPTSVPVSGAGHSLTSGSYEIGGTSTYDFGDGMSLSGTTGGKVQTLGDIPHHISGQALGVKARYGNTSLGGSVMSGSAGMSSSATPGGRNTTGIEAQASLLSGGFEHEDDDTFLRGGLSLGAGMGGRVHTGSKYGFGFDAGPLSFDAAFSPAHLSQSLVSARTPDPWEY